MSLRYKGGVISATAPTTTGGESGTATGVWTLEQQMQAQGAGNWPVPYIPRYVEDVFSTYLYTGNGSTQTITNNIDLSTKGGLVWIKNRSTQDFGNTRSHWLFDSARTAGYSLSTNSTSAESNVFSGSIPFSTTGFSINTSDANLNGTGSSAYTYVSWTFREQPKFFDIVTYTGNGTTQSISHTLGSTPGCVIVKSTSAAGTAWYVWHRSFTAGYYAFLNTTAAQTNANSAISFGNNTTYVDPTSTNFTVGSNGDMNDSGQSYVAYLFAHNAGGFGLTGSDNVITCGSLTTDGSGDATVTLGYEPQWLLLKQSSTTGNWLMVDTMRGWNVQTTGNIQRLFSNLTNAESAGGQLNPTATGFKTSSGGLAASTTYIYIAIRRGPMKTPTSGTSVFTPTSAVDTTQNAIINAGFPVDLVIGKTKDNTNPPQWCARMLGGSYLLSSATDAETAWNFVFFDSNVGYRVNASGTYLNSANTVNWMLRRAPGVFDVVCYTGTGSATTQTHNLGVAPEMMIVKMRNLASDWVCYHKDLGNTYTIFPNGNYAKDGPSGVWWNSATPTSSVFSIGTNSTVNASTYLYVAYLFASVSGVSKVGSYTGTGALQTVNCGFTGGARFVLIKRTDSTGDWWLYDSARGISSGNDPYLFLNSTAAEVAGTNYVDTTSVGFQVTAAAPAGLNANGGTYIFLAIA